MADYKGMSDSELSALVKQTPTTDYSKMSDDDLKNMVSPLSMAGDFVKSLGTGAVKGASNILSNVGQAAQTEMGQPINVPDPQETQKVIEQNFTGAVHQPQGPLGQFGEAIGSALTYGATQPIAGAGGLARALGGSAISGIGSEGAGQLTEGSPLQPYAKFLGGMFSPMAVGSASKMITPFAASPTRLNAAATLKNEGVIPTAGQTVGSDRLMRMEKQLGGSEAFDNASEAFTQAALRKGGAEMGPNQSLSDALNSGFANNSSKYNSLIANNPVVTIDRNAKLDSLQHLQDYVSKVEGTGPAPIVQTYVDRISNAGNMTGAEYNNLRSEIGRDARGVGNNPNLQQTLYKLQNSLDDAAERSIGQTNAADVGKFQEARQQYRNLLVLQHAAGKSGEAVAENAITPANLKASADAIYGRNAYARGTGDFTDLAKSGYILTPPKSSGTAENFMAQQMHAGIPAIAAGFSAVGAGHPEFSIPAALVGAAAPFAAGKALMSGPMQSYFANQLLTPYKGVISETSRRALLNALLGGSQTQTPAAP